MIAPIIIKHRGFAIERLPGCGYVIRLLICGQVNDQQFDTLLDAMHWAETNRYMKFEPSMYDDGDYRW